MDNPGGRFYANSAPQDYPPEGYPARSRRTSRLRARSSKSVVPIRMELWAVPWWVPYLPRIGCKQFQISARLWYATLNGSTIVWGPNFFGGPGTELDLNKDLGLSKHQYIAEYEARCQFRQNWGLRFNFMPLAFKDNFSPTIDFFFGNAFLPCICSYCVSMASQHLQVGSRVRLV